MEESWIKLFRKILYWKWYKKSETLHVFIHLLLKANFADCEYGEIIVKRGQLLTSRALIKEQTGISEQTIRTALKRLQTTGEIVVNSTKQGTLITVCKYDDYNQPPTNGQPTANQPPTNGQPIDKNNKNIEGKNSPNGELTPPNGDVVLPTKPPKKPKKPKKEPTLVTKGRKVFESYFSELYGDSYYWTAKDGAAMKQLFQKIKFSRTNRPIPLPTDDEALCEALHSFLTSINKSWIMDNFSVTKINSQYNDIISEIKNRQKNGYNTNNSTVQERAAGYAAVMQELLDEADQEGDSGTEK